MSMPGGGDGWAPVIAPLVDKGFRVVTFDKLGQERLTSRRRMPSGRSMRWSSTPGASSTLWDSRT